MNRRFALILYVYIVFSVSQAFFPLIEKPKYVSNIRAEFAKPKYTISRKRTQCGKTRIQAWDEWRIQKSVRGWAFWNVYELNKFIIFITHSLFSQCWDYFYALSLAVEFVRALYLSDNI